MAQVGVLAGELHRDHVGRRTVHGPAVAFARATAAVDHGFVVAGDHALAAVVGIDGLSRREVLLEVAAGLTVGRRVAEGAGRVADLAPFGPAADGRAGAQQRRPGFRVTVGAPARQVVPASW